MRYDQPQDGQPDDRGRARMLRCCAGVAARRLRQQPRGARSRCRAAAGRCGSRHRNTARPRRATRPDAVPHRHRQRHQRARPGDVEQRAAAVHDLSRASACACIRGAPHARRRRRGAAPHRRAAFARRPTAPDAARHRSRLPFRCKARSTWRWPADGSLVGRYVAGEPTQQGIDIAGNAGAPVRAAADGVVVYSGSGLVGYGELVIVKHNDQWLSAYGHNRSAHGQRRPGGQGRPADRGDGPHRRRARHAAFRDPLQRQAGGSAAVPAARASNRPPRIFGARNARAQSDAGFASSAVGSRGSSPPEITNPATTRRPSPPAR